MAFAASDLRETEPCGGSDVDSGRNETCRMCLPNRGLTGRNQSEG